jgi:hypothetical protein
MSWATTVTDDFISQNKLVNEMEVYTGAGKGMQLPHWKMVHFVLCLIICSNNLYLRLI